jgi:hypothetical protein
MHVLPARRKHMPGSRNGGVVPRRAPANLAGGVSGTGACCFAGRTTAAVALTFALTVDGTIGLRVAAGAHVCFGVWLTVRWDA